MGIQDNMQKNMPGTPNITQVSGRQMPALSSTFDQGGVRMRLHGKNHISMSPSHPGIVGPMVKCMAGLVSFSTFRNYVHIFMNETRKEQDDFNIDC